MAQIYLVRHTKVNVPQGICYGSTDVGLSTTFPDESEVIKNKLTGKLFSTVYSSPLSRCTKLAKILAPQGYNIDNRLAELNFGEWEMKLWHDIFQTPYGREWMNNYQNLACQGGESYPELFKRVSDFISELNNKENTLIITHSGVIRAFLTVLKNIPLREAFKYSVDFGEVIEINKILNPQPLKKGL